MVEDACSLHIENKVLLFGNSRIQEISKLQHEEQYYFVPHNKRRNLPCNNNNQQPSFLVPNKLG
jgi:hypothetical protein